MERLTDALRFLTAHPLVGAVIVAISLFSASTFVSYRKLQHVPGPRLAAFTQLWLARATSKGSLYLTLGKVLDEYGML